MLNIKQALRKKICTLLAFALLGLPFFAQAQTEVFMFVEQMPTLKIDSCQALGNHEEQSLCAQAALKKYIYKNTHYPTCTPINGTVYVRFLVNENGKMENFEVIKNTTESESLSIEALRVMNKLNAEMSWVPGMQNGKAVRVRMVVPFVFKLR